MTDGGMGALVATAASVGVIHTLLGPDHFVPFIAMSRAGRWSLRKTMIVTVLCGSAHVLSSVLLGAAGIAAGTALGVLTSIEASRGEIAGWLLLGFGLAYTLWGVRKAIRNRPHRHWHAHADGTVHTHAHVHEEDHVHVHARGAAQNGEDADPQASDRAALTTWALFTVFVFGPCEPLIPLMMAPAALGRWRIVALVTAVFGAATIGVMSALVYAGARGLRRWSSPGLERFAHAGAGLALTACGLAVKFGL